MISRPQRTLTEAELDMIRGWPRLCLHRALFQGLVDPVPNPSPMSEEDAAWVRAHAWKPHHREIEKGYPFGWHRYGHCERGTCWNCWGKRCDLCVHRQQGGPSVDDGVEWVYDSSGRAVATFLNLPPDTECLWWCRCPCIKDKAVPETVSAPVPEPAPAKARLAAAPLRPEHLPTPLF